MLDLIKKLNNFSTFYEMSDSTNIYNKWNLEKITLEKELKRLPKENHVNLYTSLNNIGKLNYDRYFKPK